MGRKRESLLIPFLTEAGKAKKYGSCLMYGANPERFGIHLPRKKKITCANCTKMLEDWNSSKRQNKGAQYSRAKHAILVALNKSLYVDKIPENENYADRTPENKNYCWFKVLSSKESEEKRQRKNNEKLNPISMPSPGSERYSTNSSGCSRSTDQDSSENGCLNNTTNNLSNNQNEWEIQQQGGSNSILTPPSTSEGYDSTYESPLPADPPYGENQSPYSANNFSGFESGIESPMPSDHLNSTTNGNFYEIYHYHNGVNSETLFSVTTMDTESSDQEFVQARDYIQNATFEHINTSNHQQFEVLGTTIETESADQKFVQAWDDILYATSAHISTSNHQQFEVLDNGREIQDASNKVVQDCLTENIPDSVERLIEALSDIVWPLIDDLPDPVWDSQMNDIYNAHCLSHENKVARTDERFPGVMRYKLIGENHFEGNVILILEPEPTKRVTPNSESNVLPLNHMSEELKFYQPRKLTSNISGYFQLYVIERIQSFQITDFEEVAGHILCFQKPLPTTSPRIYSPHTDSLNEIFL